MQYQVSPSGPVALDAVFPSNNSLADPLRMVARMISTASELGARRQVFFVSLGGFDTHAGQAAVHSALLTRLAPALQAFQAAMAELGVADRVCVAKATCNLPEKWATIDNLGSLK